ncbi:hypothetical protein [Ferruginibacter sp. HRS2-29]|uniref:hypothetical protein n=1 Tax=Ferruginibacter sp. HRS2-29 TaxID=2487334 RepID=UPI0020CBD715|nr:hypothetical protein [Ferruginibacter sp. HRS2-29]MCP9750376.1 hypothetical protein [Ferruginibacter sp. HRS2-29]
MDKNEILEALSRSGYLFESETAKNLQQMGFFVETNQSIKDPITNKSREIDLLAEYYRRYTKKNKRCSAKIKFVFEIKNNVLPLVLLTEYQYTPNSDFDEMFKIVQTKPKGVDYEGASDFQEQLFPSGEERKLFTQYCSFQKKKQNEELMAIHPEELHSGLSKITQYAEEEFFEWNSREMSEEESYYRNFIYIPVVLITNDLFELTIEDDNSTTLRNTTLSRLVYNYHFREEPKSAIVYIVTKAGLDFFLDDMIKIEESILKSMVKQRIDL